MPLDPIDAELIRQVAAQGTAEPWRPFSIINPEVRTGQPLPASLLNRGVSSTLSSPPAVASAVNVPQVTSGAARAVIPAAATALPPPSSVAAGGRAAGSALTRAAGQAASAAGGRAAGQAAAGGARSFLARGAQGLGKGGFVKGGLTGIAASFLADQILSQLVADDPNSRQDDLIRNIGSFGAGGAAAGAFGGLPGAAVGGLIGGGIGAGVTFLGGDSSGSDNAMAEAVIEGNTKIGEIVSQLGLSTTAQQQIAAQLTPALAFATNADEVKQIFAQVGSIIPAIALEDQANQASTTDAQFRAGQAAAVADLLAPHIARENRLSNEFAQELATTQRAAAQQVSDPELQAIFESRAARIPLAQSQLNSAHLQQLALAQAAFDSQAQISAQLAQQAQLAGNPGFAATGSIDQLLAQLG